MKPRVNLSEWRSPEAEERFRRLEDDLVAELVADKPEAIDVSTRLGSTRAYRWSGEGEPIVFLHGASGTALSWAEYADHRQGRAMHAVDTIGDVGRSRQEVAVESADDLAEWLAAVLDGLGLERAHLAGTSYGGFLALNLARQHPDRVRSLFVIEPAGIVKVRLGRFLMWGIAAMVSSLLPGRPRRAMARILRMPLLEDRRILRAGFYAQRHHKTRLLRPDPLTDDQLASIDHPTVVVIGERSEVFPAREVVARVESLMSHAEIVKFPDAGHAASVSHLAEVTARLEAFLADVDAGSSV